MTASSTIGWTIAKTYAIDDRLVRHWLALDPSKGMFWVDDYGRALQFASNIQAQSFARDELAVPLSEIDICLCERRF